MSFLTVQKYRAYMIAKLPKDIGCYELINARGVTRYVGQSIDGIQARVPRHTTSARSDLVANRLIDAGEIAYVRAHVLGHIDGESRKDMKARIKRYETYLIHQRNDANPLMNGKIPKPLAADEDIPVPLEIVTIQILPDDEITKRKDVGHLLLRHVKLHHELIDYYINVKSSKDIKRTVDVSTKILLDLTAEAGASA